MKYVRWVALTLLSAHAATAWGQTTSVTVLRFGDGAAALSTSAAAVFLESYNTTSVNQAPFKSFAIPTTGANRLTVSGSASSEGQITSPSNTGEIVFAGYDAAVGTASVKGTASATTNRVIGSFTRAGDAGSYTVPLRSSNFYSGDNFRSVVTNGSSDYWGAGTGSPGGTNYFGNSISATPAVTVSTSVTNTRVVNIFNGQLYASSGAAGFLGVNAVGTGTPVSMGNTTVNTINMGTGATPYGFVLFDTNTDNAPDLAYIADDRGSTGGGGIQKWKLVGATWTLAYILNSANNSGIGTLGVRGLAGELNGTTVSLYTTTSDGQKLATINDETTALGNTTPFIVLATTLPNTAFRGVVLGAVPEPTSVLLGCGLVAVGCGWLRRRLRATPG